jgi:hypothetical protein
MNDFIFHNPTKIIFGRGKIAELGPQVAASSKRVLLIYGQGSIKRNGVYEQVISSLQKAGVESIELSGVKPNPILSKVHEGIELAREHRVEALIAVGGGSVIDTAKAIASGFYYDGDIWDAFIGQYTPERALPLYVVLTLSASGSEMNGGAVITIEKTKQKYAFWSVHSYPQVSIIDPTVQFSLPREQTVNGAVDAISHVLELYFDGSSNTMVQDEIAEGIVRTIIKATEVLLERPDDYEARAQLAWSATLALCGLNSTGRSGGDWASHQLEHSLSALYDIAHGAGLAIVFPAWMRYVYREDQPKFARFARQVFGITELDDEQAALEGIEALRGWYSRIGAPTSLRKANIPAEDLERIVANAALQAPFGRLKRLETEDIREILTLAL